MWIVFAKPTITIAGIIAAIPCVMLMKKGTMRKRKSFEGRKEGRWDGRKVTSEGVRVTEEGGREDRGMEGQTVRETEGESREGSRKDGGRREGGERKGQEKKAKGGREGGSIVRKMQTSSFQSKQTCWY